MIALALTGSGAPEPITSQQNASSTCWPVTAKQDDLTLVTDYLVPVSTLIKFVPSFLRLIGTTPSDQYLFSSQGSDLIDDVAKAQWAITPILTILYPDGEGSPLNTTDAALSCIKVVGPSRASLDTMDNGSTDADGAATSLSSSGSYFTMMAAVATSFILFIT